MGDVAGRESRSQERSDDSGSNDTTHICPGLAELIKRRDAISRTMSAGHEA
jgi:hypothetical protein